MHVLWDYVCMVRCTSTRIVFSYVSNGLVDEWHIVPKSPPTKTEQPSIKLTITSQNYKASSHSRINTTKPSNPLSHKSFVIKSIRKSKSNNTTQKKKNLIRYNKCRGLQKSYNSMEAQLHSHKKLTFFTTVNQQISTYFYLNSLLISLFFLFITTTSTFVKKKNFYELSQFYLHLP